MPVRHRQFGRRALRITGALAGVAVVTTIDLQVVRVNGATAAFTYLILILGLATRVGLQESIAASLASMLAYNFFFLPPIRTLTIADPRNWIALCMFLLTAITVSQLSASATRKAEEASARQQELERTYEFSRALMLGDSERSLAGQIVQKVSELFQVPTVSFYDRAANKIYNIGAIAPVFWDATLRDAGLTDLKRINDREHAIVIPVRLGGRSLGSLGVAGSADMSEVALQAIAQLAAIAIERARAQDAASRTEATRQNEQLKSTLLDALAHEFKTPLTSIKAAATTVLSRGSLDQVGTELLTIVDEEADHLTSLVNEAIDVARISAGQVVLHRDVYSSHELIVCSLAHLRPFCEGRDLQVNVGEGLPPLNVDRKLTELLVRQVIDNALKYTPPSSAIRISAELNHPFVVFQIADNGPGIPEQERNLIFEKFYRGREARERIPGTGMGLTIAREIVEAHGGRIWIDSEAAKGTLLSFTLPVVDAQNDNSTQERQTAA
jgi:two-component system, OmpR family, sensor histidine kinase KdpD